MNKNITPKIFDENKHQKNIYIYINNKKKSFFSSPLLKKKRKKIGISYKRKNENCMKRGSQNENYLKELIFDKISLIFRLDKFDEKIQ